MVQLLVLVLGPMIVGIILASAWWFARGRKRDALIGGLGVVPLLTGVTLLLVVLALRLTAAPLSLLVDLPEGVDRWLFEVRFTVPLGLGVIGLLLVVLPVRTRAGGGVADLAPRTALTFIRRWWLASPAVILALVVILTVIAGLASEPDDEGRYAMYSVDLGGGRGMGTTIYGWFYSVPCLILLGVIVALVIVDLVLISRPALDRDRDQEVRVRRGRACNVLLVATGALLLHLGGILDSLAGTASVRSTFKTSEGAVTFWTSFSALQSALSGAADISAILGFAAWAAVALSAVPALRRLPVAARS